MYDKTAFSKDWKEIPHRLVVKRLKALADAVQQGLTAEVFKLSTPANREKDADYVLYEAARQLEALEQTNRELRDEIWQLNRKLEAQWRRR